GNPLQLFGVDPRRSADARRGVSPSLNQPALLNFHSLLTRREQQTPSNSPRARCALRQMTANPPSSCTVYLLKAGKSLPAGSAHSMRASGAMFPSGSRIIASTLSITLPTAQVLSVRGSGGRSISFRKEQCHHVMHPLLLKLSLMRPQDCLRPCVRRVSAAEIGRIVGNQKGRGVTGCHAPPGCPAAA